MHEYNVYTEARSWNRVVGEASISSRRRSHWLRRELDTHFALRDRLRCVYNPEALAGLRPHLCPLQQCGSGRSCRSSGRFVPVLLQILKEVGTNKDHSKLQRCGFSTWF